MESDSLPRMARRADAMCEADRGLEDLRQTLLRRQTDFDNYKEADRTRYAGGSRRATARVVEALIPIVDGLSTPRGPSRS